MKIDDIIALTAAGWSKAEICRIAGIDIPAPAPESEESETVKLLKQLTGMIQLGNINNIQQPENKPADPAEMLAQILDP